MALAITATVHPATGRPVEALERRTLLAAAAPTDLEQYLIELVNRARADPAGEAARFGIDLNEGLAAGTISAAPKAPLAVNPFLTDSARGHSQWMLDSDTFSHTGAGGSSPMQRMQAAGYVFVAPGAAGENIAWRGTKPSVPEPVATTAREHQDLFVDANYPGRGHRVNILSDNYKEIGAGVVAGEFQTYNSVMVTEDFAASGAGNFLTGVAYTDAVIADHFYTPGEGIGNVIVTARRTSDSATFTTTTYGSGGYSMKLPAGTYDVAAAGLGLGGTVRLGDVVIGLQNVKRDFRPAPAGSTSVAGRWVFYNNSVYDGHDPAATAADLSALATDKRALLPGQTASFANVTSYLKGINGVLLDFAGMPPAALNAQDFAFRVGRTGSPSTWAPAPAPSGITQIPSPTGSNTARYAITWPDGPIANEWLQVTVNAGPRTGLASNDVFYFGNLVGETGDSSTGLRVSAIDLATVKRTLNTPAGITAVTDFNRDGRVNALDLATAKTNLSRTIDLLTAPV
jgi:uncharacterized protein YkwD